MSLLPDPSFLFEENDFNAFACNKSKQKYLLIYPIIAIEETNKIGKEIAREKGLKVIIINPTIDNILDFSRKQTIDPIKFLSLIKNAEFIVTSSFHGTVYSLLMKKEFACVIKNGLNDVRIGELLNKLNLQDRITTDQNFNHSRNIDYSTVNLTLKQFKLELEEYLRKNLSVVC